MTVTFSEPKRFAIQHEIWNEDVGEWREQRDIVAVDEIESFADGTLVLQNSETGNAMLLSSENFISAWSEGMFDD